MKYSEEKRREEGWYKMKRRQEGWHVLKIREGGRDGI